MSEQSGGEMQFDLANAYREENYTDLKTGTVRRLVPVTADGSDDPGRPVIYQGQAAMMSPAGQIPLHFELPVDSLSAAMAGFGPGAQAEAQRVMEELRDLQRKQELASPIIQPPAGKIQL